jgi:hypothetical protein
MKINPDAPLCPSCGEAMRFAHSSPALRGLHELQSFVCRRCGVTLIDSNPKFWIGSASPRPHNHAGPDANAQGHFN